MSQKVHTPIQHHIQRAIHSSPDLLVIGAGIFGLWAARHALKRGERVLVLEKRSVGAGASGGFLGALMPHMPDRWNAKKQMQYEGLRSLEATIAGLEADTGLDCGYRRCGRLMPLAHEKMLDHLAERIAGADENWRDETGRQAFTLGHVAPGELEERFVLPDGKPWLSPDVAAFGAAYDTLSARVNPRAYLAALAHFVASQENGEILDGTEVAALHPETCSVTLADGTAISAGRITVANGWEAYGLLGRFGARLDGQPINGRGVKGQAVLLELPHGDDLPIIYDSGSYIVPHGSTMGVDRSGIANRIAVGSTSIDDWVGQSVTQEAIEAARTGFDSGNTDFLDFGRTLCPAITSAATAERWANVRPRNTISDPKTGKIGTQPVFGPLPDYEQICVAVGGFKISFGIAHLPR